MRPDAPYLETTYSTLAESSICIGTNSKTLQLANAPTNWYGYKLRCVVDGSSYSNAAVLKFVSYWTGAVNNQWENAGNWSCGKVPDSYTDVFVKSGMPVINSNQVVRTLSASPGVTVSISPGFNLTIIH